MQWRRQLKQHIDATADTTAFGAAANATATDISSGAHTSAACHPSGGGANRARSSGGSKRSAVDMGASDPSVATVHAVEASAPHKVQKVTHTNTTTTALSPPATTGVATHSSNGFSANSVLDDRSALRLQLESHLQQRQQDVERNSAALEHKQASVEYLRSLVALRAAGTGGAGVGSGSSYSIGSCTISEEGFEESGKGTNPHLLRLQAAEARYLVPAYSEASSSSASGRDRSSGDGGDVHSINSVSSVDNDSVRVDGVQYRVIPGTYTVQVHVKLTNTTTQVLHDLTLCAYTDGALISTTSGRVNCVSPAATITVVTLLSLPLNVFVVSGSADITTEIAINWREGKGNSVNNAPISDEAAYNECTSVMNGKQQSVYRGKGVGLLHLSINDLHPQYRCSNATSTHSGTTDHVTDVDNSSCTANLNTITSAAEKTHTCAPSVEVTLLSPAGPPLHTSTALEVQRVLSAATSSVFSMRNILQQLTRSRSDVTVSVDSSDSEVSGSAEGGAWLRFPVSTPDSADSLALLQHATQRTGVLCMPITRSSVSSRDVVLGNALLQLRQLIPKEVQLRVHTPLSDVRLAVRRAAMCLVEEFKCLAVSQRVQGQLARNLNRKTSNGARSETELEKHLSKEHQQPDLLATRILQARIESDLAISYLFSIVRL